MLLKPDNNAILAHIQSIQPTPDDVLLLLFAEQDAADIPGLINSLNEMGVSFFGGVFPGLISGNQHIKSGCIVKKFKVLMKPFCTAGIASTQLSGMPQFASTGLTDKSTAIVLLDGLTPNIYRFLEELNDLLGEQCHFIGGGAGSISLEQQPCVFANCGLHKDAAVVCVIDQQVSLGVRHGWAPLADPLVATETEGNTIVQLNWQNALDVYNQIVELDCGVALNKDNFAGIAQGYPFGILREKEDDIVRDPLAIGDNGSIICIGEVPTNTVVHVLKGEPEALLNAARQAMVDSSGSANFPIRAEGTFVVDCITRTLFLNEQFAEEMNIVRENLVIENPEQEPFGILSLGEISSYGEGLLELFNKTIVVGTLR